MASGQNETDVATKPWQSFMSDDDDIPDSDHPGDYSTRMGELFDDEDTDPEEFVYTGVDADTSTIGYHDQLRDILGQEAGEVYSPADEASQTSIRTAAEVNFEDHILSDLSERHISPNSSADSTSMTLSEPIVEQSVPTHVRRIKSRHPFLHPSVSRLRSYTPRSASRTPSDLSMASIQTPPGATPASSHFSTMSQASSLLFDFPKSDNANKETSKEREVFKWAELSSITQRFSSRPSQKANSVLGTRPASRSTALAANGMICVGTEDGSVHVFDFMQTPRCVCGTDLNAKEKTVGRVTAVALSHDHTYVASGHSTGHIFLYNLSEPNTPARSIPPTTLSGVVSGRKEGHLQGSRIVNIGFIGGRHTAIVSADEHGLAFYHNLSKVLFVEAFDTLRILGRYPEVDQPVNGHSLSEALKRRKPKFTVLASSPLPLGTSPHATDNYQVIALLTPTKLVVVGLRPSPKTWFKCPRGVDEDTSKSGSLGTLAWFPSMASPLSGGTKVPDKNIVPDPMLVYTWGNYVHLIKVTEVKAKQTVAAGQKGKTVEIGIIVHEEVCKWSTQEDIDAVQWLNANQIVVITTTALQVFDAYKGTVIEHVPFDVSSLVSPLKPPIANGDTPKKNTYHVVAHSVRVYKSKIFLLSRDRLQVGTLMTWADQILSCVEDGDFLGAIELARSYYVDEAPGNRNGLPLDAEGRRGMIGERMRGLMRASTQYAFSEERMTDDTHVTPDHRGVDRTSLFEDLVTVSCRACIALDDFEFLYEDLFQEFDDAGVARIYLLQLQPFILDNSIRYVPPRITQRLVALHEDDGRPDQIERIIWHIDPACLDINQAIRLCQVYRLYDALSYVYTCALRDYVSPIVEFLGIIRQKLLADYINVAQSPSDQDLFENAYKIYPYLETILTGHIYPSNEPLEESDSLTAKKDVYSFLFSGRSRTWPETDGGQLILTSLEEGGDEPPYPYVRQLLSFDSEWFLHTLDNAFEKAFLDEDLRQICQSITQVLLEIVSSKDVEPDDATFVRIFIARNVPKYSQFLHLSPRCSHSVLVSLAEDQDPETREDRQLAAESLLSIYHPDDLEDILRLFNEAGFYRILRQCYLHDHRWSALLTTYLDDAFLGTSEAVLGIADTFTSAQNSSRGVVPAELLMMLDCRLSDVLSIDIGSAAVLVNKYQPKLHDTAIELLEDDIKRFRYLRQLLGPVLNEEHTINISRTVPRHLSHMYLSLQCRFEPNKVIDVLQTLPPEALDWDQVLRTCETAEVYEAVVWALNWRGDSQGAIARADTYQKQLIASALGLDAGSDACDLVKATEAVVRMSITVCLQYSSGDAATSSQAEDLWFQLFRSQVYCIQLASGTPADDITPVKSHPLELLPWLRLLVQETFDSFVSVASEKTVSFPRLFKRLVESVSASSNAHYTEFRSILTGMVESYRSDGDMLLITKHLVLRDLFEVMASHSRERVMGWAPSTMTCIHCRKPIQVIPGSTGDTQTSSDSTHYEIIVSRTGTLYHLNCSPTV